MKKAANAQNRLETVLDAILDLMRLYPRTNDKFIIQQARNELKKLRK